MDHARPLPIGVILGPTASGKTALSVELAKRLNAEIVSADSIQLYRGMDIGSAKPTVEERQGIPHHLLDAVDIGTPDFSVAAYQKLASTAIREIAARGKFPLIVGGTGLYINALVYPLSFTEIPADVALRDALTAQEAQTPGSLHQRLCAVDPASAARLHPNDTKRLVRALEVYTLTGKPIGAFGGDFANAAHTPIPYEPRMIGLTMPREQLYARIDLRVDAMMQSGLLKEVRQLVSLGYTPDTPAMQGLGYKQLYKYLQGEYTLDEAIETIKRETRRFAKRQMTWFKRDKRIHWLNTAEQTQQQLLDEAQCILEGTKG
ncbi:MAG: tRNA (adenosine(37)-N6)-dimethylallyltransferase MiaA [Clostridia bacterium]|nr:tRNA (adenosine(37)-N6)-dimethylallyltransferase MiaA [Clostridia bacterium]